MRIKFNGFGTRVVTAADLKQALDEDHDTFVVFAGGDVEVSDSVADLLLRSEPTTWEVLPASVPEGETQKEEAAPAAKPKGTKKSD
jgi:hypothetical protein